MKNSAEQNDLRLLEERIKGLPNQDALKRQRNLYQSTKDQACDRAQDLREALTQLQALRKIKGDSDLLADSERRKLAAIQAKGRELLSLLAEPNAESAKLSEKLEAIKRSTRGLVEEVGADWSKVCSDHQERATAFRALAKKLSPKLEELLQFLDRHLHAGSTRPPTSVASVQAIAEARKALANEIAALDMVGPVEAFLSAAQSGQGDPKALLDPAVRDFLDAHPALWNSLRVVLS